MRSVAVNVLLGVGGVASGTAGWCSGRCSEYESSRGGMFSEGVTSGTTEWFSKK